MKNASERCEVHQQRWASGRGYLLEAIAVSVDVDDLRPRRPCRPRSAAVSGDLCSGPPEDLQPDFAQLALARADRLP
jgi:hypothetical protein